jgi:hypothetical protein
MEMNHPAWKEEQAAVERISLASTIQVGQLGRGLSEAGLERGLKMDHDLALSPSTKQAINGHSSLDKSVNQVMVNPQKLIPLVQPPSLHSLGVAVYKSNSKNNKLEPKEYKAELANMLESAAATSLGKALQSFTPTGAGRQPNQFRAMRRNSFVVHHTTPGQMCPSPQIFDQGLLYVERSQPCRPSMQHAAANPRVRPVTQFVPDQKSRKFRAVRRNSVVIHRRDGQDGGLPPCLEDAHKKQPGSPTPSQKESEQSIQIQTNDERLGSPTAN